MESPTLWRVLRGNLAGKINRSLHSRENGTEKYSRSQVQRVALSLACKRFPETTVMTTQKSTIECSNLFGFADCASCHWKGEIAFCQLWGKKWKEKTRRCFCLFSPLSLSLSLSRILCPVVNKRALKVRLFLRTWKQKSCSDYKRERHSSVKFSGQVPQLSSDSLGEETTVTIPCNSNIRWPSRLRQNAPKDKIETKKLTACSLLGNQSMLKSLYYFDTHAHTNTQYCINSPRWIFQGKKNHSSNPAEE